jgi:aryl-alcohol dehydrogenase-like predicted oxidoreductase
MERLRRTCEHVRGARASATRPHHHAAAAVEAEAPSQLRLRGAGEVLGPADVILGAAHSTDQAEHNAAVALALRRGIREFDTAPAYGDSETTLGRALVAARAREIADIRVHTKIAGTEQRVLDARGRHDWSAATAEFTAAESAKLLGRLTTIRAHGLRHSDLPSPNSPRLRDWCAPLDQALLPGLGPGGGLFAGLRDLRQRGVIDCVSLGMDTGNAPPAERDVRALGIVDLIAEAPPRTFDSALVAYGWNLENASALPVFAECQRRGIEVHIAGVLYFTGYGTLFDDADAAPEVRARLRRWRALGARHGGLSLLELAVGFASLVAGAKLVLGMVSAAEVEQNLRAVARAASIPRALWREAQAEGLIDARVPLQ